MAEMSYPPWSAPSSLEKNSKPKKWNIKRAFKKAWERKPQYKHQTKKKEDHTRSPLSPRPGIEESSFRELHFGQFSPYGPGRQKINPLSGGGNPFLFHQLTGGGAFPNYHPPTPFKPYSQDSPYEKKKSDEEDKLSKDNMFSPPTPKPNRPALSNIFPMCDSPKVNKTPVNKTKSSPVKPTSSSKLQVSNQRRNSNPSVDGASQQMLKHRPSHTYAQSTTSDITFERTGRRERRASAIRVLPTLPAADSQRSIPGQEKEERKLTNKDNMTYRPQNLSSSDGKDTDDSSTVNSWSQQPHEQLEEELEGDGPEGAEDNMGVLSCEREETQEPVIERKRRESPKSSKLLTKISSKDDFTDEFVRQLVLGDNEEDVLY